LRYAGLLILGAVAWSADSPDHVPGRLIVGSRRGVDADTADRALQRHGATVRRRLPDLAATLVDVPEEASDSIMTSLRQTGLYQYVERDSYAHTGATPDDPSFPLQWHLPKIQAPEAWAVTTGSASVVVAVIDSGVDTFHPDLAAKIVPGWNFLSNTPTIADATGHGTAVAGTLAAVSNNGIGVAGVSWASTIMPLAVVDDTGYSSYSDIAMAIQYAADQHVRILNISSGGATVSTLLQNAVDYAWSKGSVIFAAAMNDGSNAPNYPAACTHVMAVSATDNLDHLASFSNFGNWIAVAAPGTGILSTTVGGGDGYWYGTSFAAPIAAGVAALALAVNLALANADLVALLEQNADDLGTPGFDSLFGWGRVNAYKTVAAVQKTLTPVALSISPNTASLTPGQSLQLAATVTGNASAVTWSLGTSAGTISPDGLYTAPLAIRSTQTVTATATVAGVTASATITLLRSGDSRRRVTASGNR